MNLDVPKTDLERRLEALKKDPLIRVFLIIGGPIVILGPFCGWTQDPSTWIKCTVLGCCALVVQSLARQRLWPMVPGFTILLFGGLISLWYDFTKTPRPPADQYTGITLLAGLVVLLIGLVYLSSCNRKEKDRLFSQRNAA